MESIYLQGSEDVRSAASTLASAAEDIRRAAASIEESLRLHGMALDEHATRIEEACKAFEKLDAVRPWRCDEAYERYVLGKWANDQGRGDAPLEPEKKEPRDEQRSSTERDEPRRGHR